MKKQEADLPGNTVLASKGFNPFEHSVTRPPGYRLPDGAGPADYWLAVLLDPQGRQAEAARELRLLGEIAVRQAQRRRQEMLNEEYWDGLGAAQQAQILR